MSCYEPILEPRIGVDLVRVKTPDDAVRFATQYGLLTKSGAGLKGEAPLEEMSQPFADFERAAEDLRTIVQLHIDVRRAPRSHAVMTRLRERFGPRNPDATVVWQTAAGPKAMKARESPGARPEDFEEVDDRTVLIRASDWVAWGLNDGLLQSDAHPYVFEPAQLFPDENKSLVPGELRIGILPESLLGFCYLSIAQVIATEPLGRCEECQLPFAVEDGRQRFCTKACASKARFRRFKEKSHTKGKSHGKTTRKR